MRSSISGKTLKLYRTCSAAAKNTGKSNYFS